MRSERQAWIPFVVSLKSYVRFFINHLVLFLNGV